MGARGIGREMPRNAGVSLAVVPPKEKEALAAELSVQALSA
jgi:hypothetical protein